jgi:hemerythrin
VFTWKSSYNIGDQAIDEQHKELFRQLNAIGECIADGEEDDATLSAALDDLIAYAEQHFEDEEALMVRAGVDPRHLKQQQMEHHSFTYDLGKMRGLMVVSDVNDGYDQLLQFALNWLIFHTLQTDQQLGVQLRALQNGSSPDQAYEVAQTVSFGPAINRPVVAALVHLWTSAMDTVHELEAQLRASESTPASGQQ